MRVCPQCKRQYLQHLDACPSDGTQLVEDTPRFKDPLQGRVLNNSYRLDGRVGEGGMGLIYRAKRLKDGALVAVKILMEESGDKGDEHRQRFRREAELMGQLNHPNVCRLLDFGEADGGILYIVMELLVGTTLEAVIPEGGVPVASAAAVIEEICHGMAAAHALRLVHRDLKPENIFIARQEDGSHVVKVIDFGLAKTMESDDEGRLTLTGKVVGSAGFIGPEHILGSRDFTPASDIYAMGAMLFFMLTGHRPYAGDSVGRIMEQQVKEKPPSLGLPQGHPGNSLEYAVRRAMSRKPEKRFATTDEFLTAIQHGMATLKEPEDRTLILQGLTVVRQALSRTVSIKPQVTAAIVGALLGVVAVAVMYSVWR